MDDLPAPFLEEAPRHGIRREPESAVSFGIVGVEAQQRPSQPNRLAAQLLTPQPVHLGGGVAFVEDEIGYPEDAGLPLWQLHPGEGGFRPADQTRGVFILFCLSSGSLPKKNERERWRSTGRLDFFDEADSGREANRTRTVCPSGFGNRAGVQRVFQALTPLLDLAEDAPSSSCYGRGVMTRDERSPAERRRFPRYTHKLPVAYQTLSTKLSVLCPHCKNRVVVEDHSLSPVLVHGEARSETLSLGGMSLSLNRGFAPGEWILLQFPLQSELVSVRANIVMCEQRGPKDFFVGLEFQALSDRHRELLADYFADRLLEQASLARMQSAARHMVREEHDPEEEEGTHPMQVADLGSQEKTEVSGD